MSSDLPGYDEWKTTEPDERRSHGHEPVASVRPDELCWSCAGYTAMPFEQCDQCKRRMGVEGLEEHIVRAEALARCYLAEGDAETSVRLSGCRKSIAEWKTMLAALRGGKAA